MPELPEVEVTLKRVAPELIGERIKDVSVYWQRTVNAVPVAEFKRTLKGAQFKNYQRRGKYLIFELSKRRRTKILAVHLRMSGRLEVLEPGVKRRKHDRVIISLKSGSRLAFHDTRKFGRIYLADSIEEIASGLGLEPLSEEFTSDLLINL
ncbi:MAG: DNA-formamidopyrimidine glycosylase, partial [Candidatus Dadabacteria bacterium]